MITYSQSTGALRDANGKLLGTGYSGHGDGLNNPRAQAAPDVGPIPQGLWSIGSPIDTAEHGPFVLPLIPHSATDCFGRSGFLIHGDEVEHPGQHLASKGCIVLPLAGRQAAWNSGDHVLEVTA